MDSNLSERMKKLEKKVIENRQEDRISALEHHVKNVDLLESRLSRIENYLYESQNLRNEAFELAKQDAEENIARKRATACEICGQPAAGELKTVGDFVMRLCTDHRREFHRYTMFDSTIIKYNVLQHELAAQTANDRLDGSFLSRHKALQRVVFEKVNTWLIDEQTRYRVKNTD